MQSVSSEFSVEDSHGKFIVESRPVKTMYMIRRFSHNETVSIPLPGDD
jgi:hypothetical protein